VRDDRDIFFAFLAGLAIGAAVAVFATPQSGRKTRRQLRRKAEDLQDSLEEIGEDLVQKGRDLIERGRETADEALAAVGKKVRDSVT